MNKKLNFLPGYKTVNLAAFLLMNALAVGSCTPEGGNASYTIGGSVSGLNGSIVLQNNGGDDLTITSDGGFTFAETLVDGASYDVTIAAQPTGQTCASDNGVGTVSGDNITNISVICHNSGSLDASFGTGGIVTTSIGTGHDYAVGISVLADGKIITAGNTFSTRWDIALMRYNTDGSPDNTFGTNGLITTSIGPSESRANSMAIQIDGKILIGGYSLNGTTSFALVRYNSNGSLDTNFGVNGIVTTNVGLSNSGIDAITIQPDGKIIAAGYSWNSTDYDFALARYNTNGSLDNTFGSSGIVITNINPTDDNLKALAIQTDGKIIAAGQTYIGGLWNFALVRYNTNGSLDTTFDTDGIATTNVNLGTGFYAGIEALAIQTDGKIVAAGYGYTDNDSNFTLTRYNTNGSLDTTFDTDGIAATSFGVTQDGVYTISIQNDGKLLAAGAIFDNITNNDFALARYNTNGSLDTTFDTDGMVTSDVNDGYLNSITIQADGKIVAAGSINNGFNDDFAIARYWP